MLGRFEGNLRGGVLESVLFFKWLLKGSMGYEYQEKLGILQRESQLKSLES